jgi:GNAT superfamily N-acetyltransferase
MSLLPNWNFERGLAAWETTPGGVSLVDTGRKRFVLLAGVHQPAAICSDPVELTPRGAYRLEVERALAGECVVLLLTREGAFHLTAGEEFVVESSPMRVQISCPPGKRVGIAAVRLEPVGKRLELSNLRDTMAFVEPGEPYWILADIENTGSEAVEAAEATLVSSLHDLVEEHKEIVRVPPLLPGELHTASWYIQRQHRASAEYVVRLEYAGRTVEAASATLRHKPKPPDRQTLRSVDGGWQWFTIASRGLRLTAHETDFDYGPILLHDEKRRLEIGVIHRIAVVRHEKGAFDLWSRLRRRTPGGVELVGNNPLAEWEIELRPDHRLQGIAVQLKLTARKRIPGARVELMPLQTLRTLHGYASHFEIGEGEKAVQLAWTPSGHQEIYPRVKESAGLVTLATEPIPLLPGRLVRLGAVLHRYDAGIIRSV